MLSIKLLKTKLKLLISISILLVAFACATQKKNGYEWYPILSNDLETEAWVETENRWRDLTPFTSEWDQKLINEQKQQMYYEILYQKRSPRRWTK